jgi:hypothetical protein
MARFEILDELPAGRYELVDAPKEAPKKGAVSEIGRQVGLTARYGLEGVGGALDMLATPFRFGLNAVLPGEPFKPVNGKNIADMMNLPTPQNATERVVGDASRIMASGAVPIGMASQGANITQGTTQQVLRTLAANPLQQTASAGASGAAGGTSREMGGSQGEQLAASVLAGIATPYAMNKVQQAGQSVANTVRSAVKPNNVAVDVRIESALNNSGVRFADLSENIRNGIRQDVASALNSGGDLSPDAVRRLVDYRVTGATPRRSTLTLDPAEVSQEKNLAKLGINSKDRAAQTLGQVENLNNRQLITNLNNLGANTTDDAVLGGARVMDALGEVDTAARGRINARYEAARATTGRSAALDPSHFTQTANNLLDDALLGGKLPGDVRNLLNRAAQGEMPLTVDVAEQFKTRIGDLQRSTTDMAERKALGLVRQALDDTPLLGDQGQEAINAFNRARRLNRAYMGIVERTPALQAVRDGMEPDKFVQTFIVGNGAKANTMDVSMLGRAVRQNPEAREAIRTQISAHLKKAALNGAADEVGNFSQSAYNKALNTIGDRKLGMFFSPDEIAQFRAVGRVASYEQFQPRGSAVNNSNTAGSAMAHLLERVANSSILSKVPLGSMLATPAQNISIGIRSDKALNVPRSLLAPQMPSQAPAGLLMSPAAFMMPEDEKRKGLLAP